MCYQTLGNKLVSGLPAPPDGAVCPVRRRRRGAANKSHKRDAHTIVHAGIESSQPSMQQAKRLKLDGYEGLQQQFSVAPSQVQNYVPSLVALTIFMLALIGLKNFRS